MREKAQSFSSIITPSTVPSIGPMSNKARLIDWKKSNAKRGICGEFVREFKTGQGILLDMYVIGCEAVLFNFYFNVLLLAKNVLVQLSFIW